MLTPLDIENKRFSKTLKGYNVDEVDDFLDQLSLDYEKIYYYNILKDRKDEMFPIITCLRKELGMTA